MKSPREELREQISHALGMCLYRCNGNPHQPLIDEDDAEELQAVMSLIDEYERQARAEELTNLPVGLFDSTPYRDERLAQLAVKEES